MSSLEDLYGFCQFGGHSQRAPRKRRFKELSPILFVDNSNTYPCGLACNDCAKDIKTGDLTIYINGRMSDLLVTLLTNCRMMTTKTLQNPL
jgi:hypothetical protein